MTISEKDLSDREYQMLESRMRDYDKSHGLAYVLWFFLGSLGVHKFYIGKVMMGFVYPILSMIAFVNFIVTIASPENFGWWIIPLMILGFLLIYDLITIPGQIRSVKEKKKVKILNKMGSNN